MGKSVDTAEYIHKLETENEQLKKAVELAKKMINIGESEIPTYLHTEFEDIIKKARGE